MKDFLIKLFSVATFIITLFMAVIFSGLCCMALLRGDWVFFAECASFEAFFLYFSYVDYKYFFVDEVADEQ